MKIGIELEYEFSSLEERNDCLFVLQKWKENNNHKGFFKNDVSLKYGIEWESPIYNLQKIKKEKIEAMDKILKVKNIESMEWDILVTDLINIIGIVRKFNGISGETKGVNAALHIHTECKKEWKTKEFIRTIWKEWKGDERELGTECFCKYPSEEEIMDDDWSGFNKILMNEKKCWIRFSNFNTLEFRRMNSTLKVNNVLKNVKKVIKIVRKVGENE